MIRRSFNLFSLATIAVAIRRTLLLAAAVVVVSGLADATRASVEVKYFNNHAQLNAAVDRNQAFGPGPVADTASILALPPFAMSTVLTTSNSITSTWELQRGGADPNSAYAISWVDFTVDTNSTYTLSGTHVNDGVTDHLQYEVYLWEVVNDPTLFDHNGNYPPGVGSLFLDGKFYQTQGGVAEPPLTVYTLQSGMGGGVLPGSSLTGTLDAGKTYELWTYVFSFGSAANSPLLPSTGATVLNVAAVPEAASIIVWSAILLIAGGTVWCRRELVAE